MGLEKNKEFLQAFGKRVRELRKSKGYSMRGFADVLNIEYRQLARIENAEVNTSILMAHVIAQGLGVGIGELFMFGPEESQTQLNDLRR